MADGHSVAKLAGAACEAAGGIGAFFSREVFRERHPKIKKPSFTPPGPAGPVRSATPYSLTFRR